MRVNIFQEDIILFYIYSINEYYINNNNLFTGNKNERKIKLDAFTLCIICLSQKDIKF